MTREESDFVQRPFTPCNAMCIESDDTYLTDCTRVLGHDGPHSDGFTEWTTERGFTEFV